jgi:hypothetical protein
MKINRITIPILLFGFACAIICIQGVLASEEEISGEGWTCIVTKDPIIDPATGSQYASMGAMIRNENPAYWNSLSFDEQRKLNLEPAITEGCTIIGGGPETEEQKARALDLSGQTMTMAEYKAIICPDLFAVVPESMKDTWRNQKGVVDSSGVLIIEGFSSWEFTTDEEGNIISGGMTPEELAIAEENCPFNTGNTYTISSSSENAAPTESHVHAVLQGLWIRNTGFELNYRSFDMASFAASYRSGGTTIASKGFGTDVLAARGIGG